MKNKNKKNYLLWILLSTLMIVWIINITNWQTTIDTNPDSSKLHTPSLFSLFLWDNSDYTNIKIKTWKVYLDILNWLVVGELEWKGNMISWATLSVIWWWNGNMINSNNAWIGGWLKNKINNWENWAIWWWYQNEIWPQNNSKNWVIIWWLYNTDDGWWTILWWQNNKIASKNNWWIILWWQNNVAWTQSLVLWSYTKLGNAPSSKFSFIWNQDKNTTNYSARINTTGWMLINTLSPVKWVSLIVSWAINYGNKFKYNNTWWIYFNPKWCMKFFDWNVHKTLGKASIYTDCSNDESWCQFGAITLNNWDIMTAYSVSYTGNCQNASGQVTCINWEMVDNNNKSDVYVYPYCYNLSDDPIIQVEKWYQNCTKKPNHSHWTNPHFIQTLNTSTNKYEPENRNAVYDPTGSNDCSFDCDTNYTYSWNKCEWDTKRIDCDIPNELNINNIDWYFSPQYPATRGGIARASLNHETKKYSPGDTVYCKYVCKSGYTGEYCNETINYTCENKPSWSGYIFWSGTYTTWYTPTSWTYTSNSTPWICQFTCKTNYQWNGSTCELKELTCGWNKPEWSGYKFWSSTYTYGYSPTSWTYTGNSNPWACQFTCESTNNYKRDTWEQKCRKIENWECGSEKYKCNVWTVTNKWYNTTQFTRSCSWKDSKVDCTYSCQEWYQINNEECEQINLCGYEIWSTITIPRTNIACNNSTFIWVYSDNNTYTFYKTQENENTYKYSRQCQTGNITQDCYIYTEELNVVIPTNMCNKSWACPRSSDGTTCISYTSNCNMIKSKCINWEWDKTPWNYSNKPTSCWWNSWWGGWWGGWWCFLKWTPVITSEWPKNIEDIKVWDMVLSYNTVTLNTWYNKVNKVLIHENNNDELYELTIDWNLLKVTSVHPFFVINDDYSDYQCNKPFKIKYARNLKIWDKLLMSDGKYATIENIKHHHNFSTVYNLEVENVHNYFVWKWYLVHNGNGPVEFQKSLSPSYGYDYAEEETNCGLIVNAFIDSYWALCGSYNTCNDWVSTAGCHLD